MHKDRNKRTRNEPSIKHYSITATKKNDKTEKSEKETRRDK